eukprot:759189-Hanusia_phi.AAC.6
MNPPAVCQQGLPLASTHPTPLELRHRVPSSSGQDGPMEMPAVRRKRMRTQHVQCVLLVYLIVYLLIYSQSYLDRSRNGRQQQMCKFLMKFAPVSRATLTLQPGRGQTTRMMILVFAYISSLFPGKCTTESCEFFEGITHGKPLTLPLKQASGVNQRQQNEEVNVRCTITGSTENCLCFPTSTTATSIDMVTVLQCMRAAE